MIPFPNKQYEIIYADPPWKYENNMRGGSIPVPNSKGKLTWTGGADEHYPTMLLDEMKALDIASISADNALLFMWTSSPHLDEAMKLGPAWGFKWATIGFIWHKEQYNPGSYTMSECEVCLIFKKGNIPQPRGSRNQKQFVAKKRTQHSKKPSEVRKRIEKMFPKQSKIELFARQTYFGWDAWGNEVNKINSENETFETFEQESLF